MCLAINANVVMLTSRPRVRVTFKEPKKSCANRSTVWFTESPGGLTAGAFVYKGQESRPFASTASREHRLLALDARPQRSLFEALGTLLGPDRAL